MPERILITGARAAAALDLARDFRRLGYEIHMADCAPARISRWSRAVTGFHHFASPVVDPERFHRDIARIVDAVDPVIVVPTCEEIFHLAMPPTAPHLGSRLLAPRFEVLAILHDKAAFAEACVLHHLPVPETHRLSARSFPSLYADDSSAWVFKSCFSRFGEGTMIAPDRNDLSRITPTPEMTWIAQRRVSGEEVSFYALAQAGSLRAFAAYRGEWRLPGGASLSFTPVSVDLARLVEPLAEQLARALAITGQFACDLIIDEHGQPWLIECNPRATSGVHLLTGAGALAGAMTNSHAEPVKAHSRCRHLLPAMLTFGLRRAVAENRIGQWRAQLRRGEDVAGTRGDRWPVAGAIVDGLGFMIGGARRGISATAASTADIEWNGGMAHG